MFSITRLTVKSAKTYERDFFQTASSPKPKKRLCHVRSAAVFSRLSVGNRLTCGDLGVSASLLGMARTTAECVPVWFSADSKTLRQTARRPSENQVRQTAVFRLNIVFYTETAAFAIIGASCKPQYHIKDEDNGLSARQKNSDYGHDFRTFHRLRHRQSLPRSGRGFGLYLRCGQTGRTRT